MITVEVHIEIAFPADKTFEFIANPFAGWFLLSLLEVRILFRPCVFFQIALRLGHTYSL